MRLRRSSPRSMLCLILREIEAKGEGKTLVVLDFTAKVGQLEPVYRSLMFEHYLKYLWEEHRLPKFLAVLSLVKALGDGGGGCMLDLAPNKGRLEPLYRSPAIENCLSSL